MQEWQMLANCYYQIVINTLWNKIRSESCMTSTLIVANFCTIVLNLNICLQGFSIGVLELLISSIKGLIGTTTHLTIFRLHQTCVSPMRELNFLTIIVKNIRENNIRIVQDSEGFTCRTKDFSSSSQ